MISQGLGGGRGRGRLRERKRERMIAGRLDRSQKSQLDEQEDSNRHRGEPTHSLVTMLLVFAALPKLCRGLGLRAQSVRGVLGQR